MFELLSFALALTPEAASIRLYAGNECASPELASFETSAAWARSPDTPGARSVLLPRGTPAGTRVEVVHALHGTRVIEVVEDLAEPACVSSFWASRWERSGALRVHATGAGPAFNAVDEVRVTLPPAPSPPPLGDGPTVRAGGGHT